MNILTPSTSTNRPTSEHVLHPKAFQAWRWLFLAAILLATVAITTFYFSSAQAQGADGAISGPDAHQHHRRHPDRVLGCRQPHAHRLPH